MEFLGISWNILEILGISWQLFDILGIFEQFLAKAQSFEVWMCSFTNVHPLLSLANCDLQPALFWGLWENGVVLELHIIQVLGFLHLLLIFGITFDFNLCLGLLQFFSPDFFLPCICTGCFHCFGLGFSFCRSLANSAPAPNLTTQEESHLSGFLCWGVCAFRRQRPPIFDTILPQWEACFFCIHLHSISFYFHLFQKNISIQYYSSSYPETSWGRQSENFVKRLDLLQHINGLLSKFDLALFSLILNWIPCKDAHNGFWLDHPGRAARIAIERTANTVHDHNAHCDAMIHRCRTCRQARLSHRNPDRHHNSHHTLACRTFHATRKQGDDNIARPETKNEKDRANGSGWDLEKQKIMGIYRTL